MIRIQKINVHNYRKFHNVDLYMDRSMTAVAGSNNAGKTSFVELMSSIFMSGRTMTVEDLNYNARKNDIEKLESIINDTSMAIEEKIEVLNNVNKSLSKITVFISIQYDDNDELDLFSDYLSDYDPMKKNYYFIVEYGYKKNRKKDIEEVIVKKRDVLGLFSSLESIIYYCNENAEDRIIINNKDEFYKLFNFHCVYALRKLSDTSEEKQNFLSKHLLKTVKNDENWKNGLDELVNDINQLLIDKKLSNRIDEITIDTIKQTLEDFSETNGGNTGKLGIDFRLENQDIEKVVLEFTKIYFEQDGGGKIKEQKQGLGYSNLIFLLLETQIFREKIDNKKVNLLVFEEPEAHLHPQMENIFIQYLNRINTTENNEIKDKDMSLLVSFPVAADSQIDIYGTGGMNEAAVASDRSENKNSNSLFQLFITTHSSEMAKSIKLSSMRVIRPTNHIESHIFDLEQFISNLDANERAFYNKFFQFNMVEMVFADKLILFEGDAERLFLKYVIASNHKFKRLASQYISYIQVGGAYAYNYLKIVNFLQIKTLILSDIDYECHEDDLTKNDISIIKEVLKRNTTNQTIQKITGKNKVKDVIKFQMKNKGLHKENRLICLKFQTNKDGYARTLEDSILYRMLEKKTVFCNISKTDFNSLISKFNLQIPGPKTAVTSIRDRVDKLQQKTDFMYSLIENNQINKSVPTYIEEGLEWLQE